MKRDYIIDTTAFKDFYDVLGLGRHVEFIAIKKAYYRRAKECHPDTGIGCDAEFKLLVTAFDVLSDPDKRRQYDHFLNLTEDIPIHGDTRTHTFTFSPHAGTAIMDSLADDILEELIVSNSVPKDATIQTLMRDLKQTETFMTFREAKNCMAHGQYARTFSLTLKLCKSNGRNILHHYYLGLSAEHLRRWSLADKHYKICLAIGDRRVPPQRLERIQCRLFDLRRDHGGLFGTLRNLMSGDPPRSIMTPEDRMVEETSRIMSKMLGLSHKPQKKIGNRTIGTNKQLKG